MGPPLRWFCYRWVIVFIILICNHLWTIVFRRLPLCNSVFSAIFEFIYENDKVAMENTVQNIGAFITLLLGLLAIIFPMKIEKFVSIQGIGKEGKSEVRATYGGFFAGIAIYAIATQNTVVFITIGIGWLSAAIIRAVSLAFGSYTHKNIGGVFFEAFIGLLCISSLLIN